MRNSLMDISDKFFVARRGIIQDLSNTY
ncbi:hypothetical protein H0X06_06945 [Candidatus Dependentiae bacterium]|nr:hypothetical protein [Candidatus Dependentiae bacterium]